MFILIIYVYLYDSICVYLCLFGDDSFILGIRLWLNWIVTRS